MDNLKDILNKRLDLTPENEKELINFIRTTNINAYTGKDEENNDIVVDVRKNISIEIATYQANGWIRINSYELVEDDEGNPYILESETYKK